MVKMERINDWDQLPLLLSVKDLSNVMGIGITASYQLAKRGGFPSLKVGNRIIVPRDALIRWLEEEAKIF